MRLVIEFTAGDGYTYSCTETVPVEYESAEAFAVDFEKAVQDSYDSPANNFGEFMFAGHKWRNDNHGYHQSDSPYFWMYDAPNIFTVDEWFELRKG